MTITSNNSNNNQHQQQTADNNQSSSSQPNQPLNTFKQSSDHTNNQQHQHGSRLTRFLSKFTNTNLSYRRKSSLPNLNQHNQLSPFSSSTIPRNKLSNTPQQGGAQSDKHLENQSIRPSSSTSDLLPFSEESTNELEVDDGADPNASIRPLTPSSKAASNRSPTQPICTLSPVSQSVSQRAPHHLTDSTSESLSIQSDPNQINNNLSSSSSSSLNNNSSNNNNNNNNNDYDTNSSIASTKPTTVISVDQANTMIGNNRIAQNSPRNRIIHRSNHLNSSNHLIQSNNNRQYHHQPRSSSSSLLVLQPATPNLSLSNSNLTSSPVFLSNSISKAPKHSLPHPSQNPHPAALADNASMLTLASSGFAPSLHTTQNFPPDEDASVRALAPSRRESIESLNSRYSLIRLDRNSSLRTTGTTSGQTGLFIGVGGDDDRPISVSINHYDEEEDSEIRQEEEEEEEEKQGRMTIEEEVRKRTDEQQEKEEKTEGDRVAMNNKLPDGGQQSVKIDEKEENFSSEPVVDEMMRGCLVEIGKGDEKNEESDDGGRIIDGGNNTGKVCSADDEHTEKPNR